MKGKQDIAIIQEKQKQLDYESFVKYLFDIGLFKNKYLREGVNVYDITPTNKEQAEILERISIEHAKNNPSGFFEKPTKLKNKLLVPFVPFEILKQKLQESLEAPFAKKEAVISNYKKKYLEPLQETKNEDTAQRIYKSFETSEADNIGKKDYFYYATKAAVMELLKFEDYLNTLSAHKKNEKTIQPDKVKNDKPKLSLREVAIKCYYEGVNAETIEGWDEIAIENGYKSGKKLQQYHNKCRNNTDRRAYAGSPIKHRNKIERFENVMEVLAVDKDKIQKDIELLISRLDEF